MAAQTVTLYDKDGNILYPMSSFESIVTDNDKTDNVTADDIGFTSIVNNLRKYVEDPRNQIIPSSGALHLMVVDREEGKLHTLDPSMGVGIDNASTYVLSRNGKFVDIDDVMEYVPDELHGKYVYKFRGISVSDPSVSDPSLDRIYLIGTSDSSDASRLKTVKKTKSGEQCVYVHNFQLYQTSDENRKDILEDYSIDIDKLKKIRKILFRWKDSANDSVSLGVTAQSVKDVCPYIVDVDSSGNMAVSYEKLSILALSAIDKIDERLSAVEKKIGL